MKTAMDPDSTPSYMCVCVNIYIYIYIYIHSCVQNNSSVFKKASKAQNPYNNFYFNTHKCIGNIAHSILNQDMKKNFANLLLLYRKWKKRNIKLFKKNSSVCIFLYKVKHFLKWRDIRPSMVTHTQNLCSAFNPSKVHTQLWTHTHTHTVAPPPPLIRHGISDVSAGPVVQGTTRC